MTKRIIKTNKKDEKEKEKKIDLRKIFKVSLIVIIVLLACYFITGIFIVKDIKLFDNNANDVKFQNENILVTETFTVNNDEYYVFLYDKENSDYEVIKNKIDGIQDKIIYKVDLQNQINNTKVGSPSNKNAQNYNELKINGNTVIKISEGKNVLYLEGKNEIINNFN